MTTTTPTQPVPFITRESGRKFERIHPPLDAPVHSLYVHVPFCSHKCEYCAFYSALPSGDIIQRYVDALVREMELIAPDAKPATVFFGGGTPSLLTLKQWEQVFRAMDRLNLMGAREWTVECNPATVSADKARLLRDHGVNRISMGVQSLDESLLDRLGRVHSRSMVFRSYDILRSAGFENISIDLMFAIPRQTLEVWEATLTEALAMGTEHLSCYEVIYEEDTPLYQQLQAGEIDIDEDLACSMYEMLIDKAGAVGLRQYEIANFARDHRVQEAQPSMSKDLGSWAEISPAYVDPEVPHLACRHNIGYWRAENSFGLGPAASELIGPVRSRNWANTTLYCETLEKGFRAKEFSESLAPLQRAGETAAFGLRMNAGWPFDLFQARTGFDLRDQWADDIQSLVQRGWATVSDERIALTSSGLRFADAAGSQFLKNVATA